ncbi:MAG: PKD domain-containing protein [Flavobacteriales bacterium]|nr:PKD domain-containing protein [Flavobacteriales bacterium]
MILLISGSGTLIANCPAINSSFTPSVIDICGPGPNTISFINNSTGANASTATYDWYVNGVPFDNTSGLGAPNDDNISAVGTYTYLLVANDSSGSCTDSFSVDVIIHPIPNPSFTFNPNNACAGTTITFTNTSSGNDPYSTYSWDFGDGNTSAAANPTHAYTAGGTYNVVLTMTNAAGCTNTFNLPVTALPVPVINISGDDGNGDLMNCLLPNDTTTFETVTFTNNTTGAVSFSWDYGDGSPVFTTAATGNHTHTYSSYGTFTVTFTATGANGCVVTQTLTVVFEKYVSASFVVPIAETSGCLPHTVNPQNASVNANVYVWNFGDGTPPVTTTSYTPPAHVYNTPGNFTITVTASNSCNSSTATVGPIIITGPPVANFNNSLGSVRGCAPQVVSFNNSSTGASPGNNYQWNMGNGNNYSNTTTPPNQTYNQGQYTITLIASNACGSDTISQAIIVDSIPTVFMYVNPLEGCTPLQVNGFDSAFGANLTTEWFADNVFQTNNDTIPTQTFVTPPGNTATTHTIRLRVFNQCGLFDSTVTILVHPAVQAIFTPTIDTICEGSSVTFSQSSMGDSLTYSWNFGNGNTSNTAGPHTQTYATAGDFNVQFIVDGYCGADTLPGLITVIPYPIADILPDVLNGCEPLTVNFVNNSSPGASSYNWNFGSGIPATSTVFNPGAVTFSTAGQQMITLDVDSFGCVVSDTVFIDVYPLPQPSFTVVPPTGCSPLNVAFNNTSPVTAGDTYSWAFGNGNTSTAQNPANQNYSAPTVDTNYTVQLTIQTANGCVDSITQTVTVHPNPVAGILPSKDTACVNENIIFSNNSIGAVTYSWDFGDGNTSTAITPTHAYGAAGTYTVQLIATSNFGCPDTTSILIVIDSIPTSNFGFSIECVGNPTVFTDSSFNALTWAWDFGDGNSSTAQNPVHTYAAAGTYNVTLTTTNAAGCPHTVVIPVVVNAVAVAAFTNTQTCLGQPMNFTDQSSGTPISWDWDFGDGNTSTVQNSGHVYAAVGTYTVQLIVAAGSGCFDTIAQTVTVDSIPSANFIFSPVCSGDTTFFNSTSTGGPDTYSWVFGDGNTDNTNNPSPFNIYATAGLYNVQLIVGYSTTGCTDTITQQVDAYPHTLPAFTTNTPCLNDTTYFTDQTGNTPNSWNWDFGDGNTSTAQNPAHLYASAATYTVTLTTSNAFGCTDSVVQTVTVNPLPTAEFGFDTVCLNNLTSFSDSSLNAVSWVWGFGDGNTSTSQNPTHLYATAGTYNVQLVVTNVFGCTDSIFHQIIVRPNPFAGFTADTVCFGFQTSFVDTSNGSPVSWQWNFGDGNSSSAQNPFNTYPVDSSYMVQLIVSNTFGCMDSVTNTVVVLPQPTAGFDVTLACAKQVSAFVDTSSGTPNNWSWDFGDGNTSTLQNPNNTYLLGGTYNVQLIIGNGAGCSDTLIQTITVSTVPTPGFTADTVCFGNVTTFTNTSTDSVAFSNFFWDFGDGNNSNSQNPTYIYQAPGTYNVTLVATNINGCDSTIIIPVIVNPVPAANYVTDTVCLGSPTTFTDLSTGTPASWIWDFGDGNTGNTGPVITHTYATAGSFLTSLTVSGGSANCSDQLFKIVIVVDDVVAGIGVTTPVCDGDLINFTDNSTINSGTIASWFWDFGDGNNSTLQNPAHTYAGFGVYTVMLTVTSNGGCTSTDSITLTVNENPSAIFFPQNTCLNDPSVFTDQSTGNPTSWAWDFGDGGTSILQNPVHTYGASGQYNVTLTVTSDSGCTNTIIEIIRIYDLPNAAFSSTLVCLNDTMNFTDLSTIPTGSIVGWDWDFGDGGSSILQNPGHVYSTNSQTFNVQLVVTSNQGCTDTTVQQVNVYPVPSFDFFPLLASGCEGDYIEFQDTSYLSSGFITNYVWDFGDGFNSFLPNPVHQYTTAGNYTVSLTLTTSDNCTSSDTLAFPVIIYPNPTADFTPSPPTASIYTPVIEFIDNSTGASSWIWDFGDGQTSMFSNPEHSFPDTGYYLVTQIVISNFGCRDTIQKTIRITGEYALFIPNAFTPDGDSKNNTFFPKGIGIKNFTMLIFDRWGEQLYETHDLEQGWDGTYQGKPVPIGVYVYRILTEDILEEEHEYIGKVTVLR